MREKPSLDDLVHANPLAQGSGDRIRRLTGQAARLMQQGMLNKGYDLASPFGGKFQLRTKDKAIQTDR